MADAEGPCQDTSMLSAAADAEDGVTDEKVPVTLEVCQASTSTATSEDIASRVRMYFSTRGLTYRDGPLSITPGTDPYLDKHVDAICMCDTEGAKATLGARLLSWQVDLSVYVHQLNDDDVADGDADDDAIPSYREWVLPAREFDNLWSSLVYESNVKQRLLLYAASAVLFGERGVNSQLVSFNRTVLLHGPPGTGKTTLCKALAQKLSVRFHHRFPHGQLIEVNAHSLFSKWFSESGKLVSRLFAKIMELVEEEHCLVFVLIDEVESLTAARKAAVAGSEPADAIRAVNALLTHARATLHCAPGLDALRGFPNVLVFATSNITEAIDAAFIDRADIKAYVGPPGIAARYSILRSCMAELQRANVLLLQSPLPLPFEAPALRAAVGQASDRDEEEAGLGASLALLEAARACEGFSGRMLRKLPFLAHAVHSSQCKAPSCEQFAQQLKSAALLEATDRAKLDGHGTSEAVT